MVECAHFEQIVMRLEIERGIKSMQVSKDHAVEIHYTLKNDAGEVLDSSEGEAPLPFLCGAQNIIAGLEDALLGKKVGDKVDVTVEAADGYGEYREDLIQKAPREAFQGVDTLEVGMEFHAQTPEGLRSLVITEINGDEITVDGNHPLAGQRLHFAVSIESIREATKEELDHGHIHAAGGCGS